jgi:hypothetical protein
MVSVTRQKDASGDSPNLCIDNPVTTNQRVLSVFLALQSL